MNTSRKNVLALAAVLSVTLLLARAASPPAPGEVAPNFTLRTLDDKPVELKQLTAKRPVVLVVLRGWPGYQCPLCTRQVNDFVSHASELDASGAQVLMVYPGPAADLKAHAQELLQHKNLPKNFIFVVDPDYSFTKSYGLRWEAKNETAYPATLIVDKENKVRFVHISKQHGDRVGSAAALKALGEAKR